MNKQLVIKKPEEYVKNIMQGESTGHDLWHVDRVRKTAVLIAKKEKADRFIVELAALLHDISDWKFNKGDDEVGPRVSREWLEKMQVEESIISQVCDIIKATYCDIDFKENGLKEMLKSKEAAVVWDADKLDALGAIGIARTFAYGGNKGREIYNPDINPEKHDTFEQYKNSKGPTINHFYEKLLLLKDLMNTKTAKDIAKKRHHFMKKYLAEFYVEWEGKDINKK
jgi:uncharacterized protein